MFYEESGGLIFVGETTEIEDEIAANKARSEAKTEHAHLRLYRARTQRASRFLLLNAPGAFHSKRFNLEMNAGGVLFYLTPGVAYRENLAPLRSLILRLSL